MFDIGFWELTIIAIIGLIVVGPEQLPDLVRTLVGLWRKLTRTISEVRADIERELDVDEIRKLKDDINIQKHINELNAGIMSAENDGKKWLEDMRGDFDSSRTNDGEHDDGFTPENANAEIETGEEKISLLKKDNKPS